MPKPVVNAIVNYLADEEYYGGYEIAEKRASELQEYYYYAARLFNSKSTNIAYTTNATDSYNKALSSIPFRKGDVILISENDYPSNFIAFLSMQKRLGIKLKLVKNIPTGEIDLDDLEKKVKKHEPKLVSLTHVPTSSGLVQPVTEVGDITRKYDTLFLLDACQSLGQLPVEAAQTNADFISGTFRKFLRGPRGGGLLYVSEKALSSGLEPLYLDLRGADWVADKEYNARHDARRFEVWETAYALMIGGKEALKYMLTIGLDDIQEQNKKLLNLLRKELENISSIQLQDKGEHLCNIVSFSVPNRDQHQTKQYFSSKGINIYTTPKSSALIDYEEKGIDWTVRVSPHYYNTEDEIGKFIEAVKQL